MFGLSVVRVRGAAWELLLKKPCLRDEAVTCNHIGGLANKEPFRPRALLGAPRRAKPLGNGARFFETLRRPPARNPKDEYK